MDRLNPVMKALKIIINSEVVARSTKEGVVGQLNGEAGLYGRPGSCEPRQQVRHGGVEEYLAYARIAQEQHLALWLLHLRPGKENKI